MEEQKQLVSIGIINSRGAAHGDWVHQSIQSALHQNIPVDVITLNNMERQRTIGECWNIMVKEAKCDWILFLGDDDFISHDLCELLYRWANSDQVKNGRTVCVTTNMTAFEDETGKKTALARQHTGMWKREYLLKHPFNEKLTKGIDREYIEETLKRGDFVTIVEYFYGYFYRKHSDYSCAGDITFIEKPADYYFLTSNRIFLHSITERFAKTVGAENIIISPHTNPETIEAAKVIWVEWANEKAVDIQNADVNAYKILRLHAYEAFHDTIKNLNLNKFDKVIFIDEYIKDYVERQYGKVHNAVVIPNGVEIDRFTLNKNKVRNNKIAFAGYLTRKKGIGELILLAESLPAYEFHLAGRYQEDDIADYFNHKKPKNVFVHEWMYDEKMPAFYDSCSYIMNSSLRESQSMTVCEAMAMGCSPLIRGWIDADKVYKPEWVYNSIEEFRYLLENPVPPEECRKFIIDNYSIDNIYPKLEQIILSGIKKVKVA